MIAPKNSNLILMKKEKKVLTKFLNKHNK